MRMIKHSAIPNNKASKTETPNRKKATTYLDDNKELINKYFIAHLDSIGIENLFKSQFTDHLRPHGPDNTTGFSAANIIKQFFGDCHENSLSPEERSARLNQIIYERKIKLPVNPPIENADEYGIRPILRRSGIALYDYSTQNHKLLSIELNE